jgi:hypothetical protein
MHRLRQSLERYYADEGQNDPVLIEFPKGSHAPRFSERPYFSLPISGVGPSATSAPAGPRKPMDFRVAVSTLTVLDSRGREVWRHQFDDRTESGWYEGASHVRRCAFADIDGDGAVETLFVFCPISFGRQGSTLFCFSESGDIKWTYRPGRPEVKDNRRVYKAPYFISNVVIVPVGPDRTLRILVSSNHHAHNPNQVVLLEPRRGKIVSEYWHSGHLLYVAHADLNNDGSEEILLAGVDNAERCGTLVVFDSREIDGSSHHPKVHLFGFRSGTEKAIVLFPRSCISRYSEYNRVIDLRITDQRRILVVVNEGISEVNNPGQMIYGLDYKLRVVSASPDGHLLEKHAELFRQKQVDHRWTDAETEDLRKRVRVLGKI